MLSIGRVGVALAVVLSAVPPGAAGQGTPLRDAYFGAVAEFFEIPRAEVAILAEGRLPPDEIPVVLFVARRAGVSAEAVVALREAGRAWGELAGRYGLDGSTFHVPLGASEPAGVLAGAYERFRALPPARWREVALGDAEVVGLVNLRVLAQTLGRSPGEVLAATRGGSWVDTYGRLAGAAPGPVSGTAEDGPRTVPLSGFRELPPERMKAEAERFLASMRRRRSVRDFSPRPVPRDVLERCILAAGTAPNGANRQPWRFVAVSDPEVKRRIREAAEAEERAFYSGRAPEPWLRALAHLGTDERKPFLETAPWLVAIFAESWERTPDGGQAKNYYVTESVGIATGILITALHRAGLATLTHTPSPMKFLNEVLGRPENERPFLLLVVGYPAEGARVPDIAKKPLEEIAVFIE